MASDISLIMGGYGTKKIGANVTIDNVEVAAVYITEDAANLKLWRAPFANETEIQEVTNEHFNGTTPKAGDLVKGFGYNFWKVSVGSSGAATLIYDKKK
jgi:hypothetical protein